MNERAILCVDDEAIILMALKQELKSHFRDRFLYETAVDAEEALAAIDELVAEGVEVILVISDWLMPGMKGDEFLLKVHERHPGIGSIMVTGHADPESIARVRSALGGCTIISKPWRREDLIGAVETCVDA
ncbi:MAG: response regulator [Spirochaetia bacterium]|nr:response regulator [Spirochaetia bacterium]